jgi:thiosulfate dehydrogenase
VTVFLLVGQAHGQQGSHVAAPPEDLKPSMDIPDPPKDYPAGELGKLVKLGEEIFMKTDTHPLTKDLVGNILTCNSCHLDGGKTKSLGTLIGTAASFPAYSPREKTVQTLQDRNDNCFMRSMNGIRPAIDSPASLALMAYVSWLSEGIPMKMNDKKPITMFYTKIWPGNEWVVPLIKQSTHENYLAGKEIWEKRCAQCHEEGLWGDQSYNTGAGMAKLNKAPMWLLFNMPFAGEKLTRREAVDVTLYMNAQPRPDFDLQKHLPPASEGLYNSAVTEEKHSVRSNFKEFGLDIDEIRGDKVIP